MPELPEVETMRRGVAPVVGAKIVAVERPKCRCKPIAIEPSLAALRRRAVGRTIKATDRVGKRVVVWLDSGEAIIFEPRMAGLVLLADPPTKEHLRLRIRLTGAASELMYWDRRGLGSVRILSADEFRQRYAEAKIGPDALKASAAIFRKRFEASRAPIKVALLDQRRLAGVGNLYASEMLYVARVHPSRSCDSLTAEEWKRLHAAMRRVLQSAIRYEGSTLSDGTYRNALNQRGRYQQKHFVYARAGKPCPSCGEPIERIVQAQRSTFFCPRCQPFKSDV